MVAHLGAHALDDLAELVDIQPQDRHRLVATAADMLGQAALQACWPS